MHKGKKKTVLIYQQLVDEFIEDLKIDMKHNGDISRGKKKMIWHL